MTLTLDSRKLVVSAWTAALFAALSPALRASHETLQTEQMANEPASDAGGLLGFINQMPDLIDKNLPFLERGGTYWFYARPHVGNPLRGKYLKLDAGGWLKINDRIDLNLGAQSYVWKDAKDNNSIRRGFSGVNAGIKYEQPLDNPPDSGMSLGVNFVTPVSRPPMDFTDGYRHTNPYVSYTRPLDPKIRLVGFTSMGLDLMEHSSMPSNFGKNQLHSNNIGLQVGVSREWQRFAGSIALSSNTTALMSKHALQRFELNPEIYIPLFPGKLNGVRATLNLSVNGVTGPDGTSAGGGASIHLSLEAHRKGH